MAKGTCTVEGCDAQHYGLGMCRNHWRQKRRAENVGPLCTVDGCNRRRESRGWCRLHYQRWKSNGDPLVAQVRGTYKRSGQYPPSNKGTSPVYQCKTCGITFQRHGRTRRRHYCSNKCQGLAMSGPNHPAWKGGVTPKNEKIRKSRRYAEWRLAIFRRDDFTCQLCGARNGKGRRVKLNADHIKPFSTHPELRFDLDNGRTLCVPCHIQTPTWGGSPTRTSKDECYRGHSLVDPVNLYMAPDGRRMCRACRRAASRASLSRKHP